MRHLLFLMVVVAGCTKADEDRAPQPVPRPTPAPGVAFAQPPPPAPTPTPPPPPPATLEVTVELTAVTLADDCGGSPAAGGTTTVYKSKAKEALAKGDSANGVAHSRARRRCEQTSMQLAVSASAASQIQIKSVELLDASGASLGMLTASRPTRWAEDSSMYSPWDEMLAADTPVKVSYVLTQPNWAQIGNRWNRTYTLRTVVSIGGVDRSVQKQLTLSAPTTLPPNVKT